MHIGIPLLLAQEPLLWVAGGVALAVLALIIAVILYNYIGILLWAYMSSANISL